MCGIVGYIGDKQAAPLLLDGLKKLEYRGYDSAGLAIVGDDESITVAKERGRLSALYEITNGGEAIRGCVGIGHTRWATHGEPNQINAHPHVSMSGRVALVHNGIIENYAELKAFLIGKGYTFTSETDSEVAVQLIDYYYDGDPMEAVRLAEAQFVGSYAMAIVFADREDEFIALRKDSPLILGLGEGENFIASDAPALLKHTRRIIRLGERELAVVRREGVAIYNSFGERVEHEPINITWDVESAEKNGYDHFMLKEIMEQPDAIRRTVAPRIKNGQIELGLSKIDADVIRSLERVYIVACGSAYHVGMVARYAIERYAKIPVSCDLASEFRYDDPMVNANTLVIIISQSGETARSQNTRRAHAEHCQRCRLQHSLRKRGCALYLGRAGDSRGHDKGIQYPACADAAYGRLLRPRARPCYRAGGSGADSRHGGPAGRYKQNSCG